MLLQGTSASNTYIIIVTLQKNRSVLNSYSGISDPDDAINCVITSMKSLT